MKNTNLPLALIPVKKATPFRGSQPYAYLFKSFMFLLLALVGLSSCEEKDKPKPTPSIIANAGTDQTVNLSQLVTLDGSASSDNAGKTIAYNWIITAKPTGSNATLTNPTQAKPTFTPDVAGDYEMELTVTSESGTSKDKVVIKVNGTGNPNGPLNLSEPINADRVLQNIVTDPNLPDYFVTQNLLVNAKLTIMPGVVMAVESDKGIYVNNTGAIVAKGTATQKIIFTGKEKIKGFWEGILISSNNQLNELDYVEVAYAASSNLTGVGSAIKAAVVLNNVGTSAGLLKINNTIITQSNGYGLYLHGVVELNSFANNTFSHNTGSAVYLPANQVHKLDAASSLNGSNGFNGAEIYGLVKHNQEVTWPAFSDGSVYLIVNDVMLESGVKVAAGAKFEVAADKGFYVTANGGYLVAKGTAANKISFTGRSKVAGFWAGIMVASSNALNELNYVEVAHAGKVNLTGLPSSIKSNLVVYGAASPGGKLKVSNSSFTHSGGYGVFVQDGAAELTSFSNNSFSHNNGAAMYVTANQVHKLDAASKLKNSNGFDGLETKGTIAVASEISWPAFTDGAAYYVTGDIILDTGLKLEATASAAPIFKFSADKALYVRTNGYLIAKGTAQNKISFSGHTPQKGFWSGIMIASTSSANEMTQVTINHGGKSNMAGISQKANLAVTGNLKITNSAIGHSAGYGLLVKRNAVINTDASTANTFDDNTTAGYFKEN